MANLGQAVLFGGSDAHGDTLGDTWTWAAGCWTRQQPLVAPAARHDASMAYDSARKLVILYGTYVTSAGARGFDTWAWNGSAWSKIADGPISSSYGASAAFDENPDRVVLLTKSPAGLSQTWTWDGASWQAMSPQVSPPGRFNASMAFDPSSRRVILFGGYGNDGQPLADTWAWDGNNWTALSPRISPPARAGAAITTFASKHSVVLIGGEATAPFSDAWNWDGTSWSPLAPPGPRQRACAIDIGPRVLVFGGNPAGDSQSMTWDGQSWAAA
jgi:hypothetical protein